MIGEVSLIVFIIFLTFVKENLQVTQDVLKILQEEIKSHLLNGGDLVFRYSKDAM